MLGYVQDVAWRHSEALGFPRAWYREKGVAWLVRAVEARMLAPIRDGDTVTVTTRLTGYRKVLARRETAVSGPTDDLRAVVVIDWAMTDGRAPVRIPAEFEHAPIDGPGPFAPVRVDLPPTPPGAGDPLHAAPPRAGPDEPREQRRLPRLARRGRGGDGPGRRRCHVAAHRTYRLEYLRPAGPGQALVSEAWRDDAGWAYRLSDADGGPGLLCGTICTVSRAGPSGHDLDAQVSTPASTTRLRPVDFATYRAPSARWRSVPGVSPGCAIAPPRLMVTAM